MSCIIFTIDPLDKRKVTVDFTTWLGSSTIASVAWVVPSGITQSNASNTQTAATNYFEPVVATEKEYEIAVTATTADAVPRNKTQRFLLRVEQDC